MQKKVNLINRRRLLWLLPVVFITVGGASLAAMMQPPPKDLDLSMSRLTDKGLYVGTLEASLSPVTIGKTHSWTVTITTPKGTPVENATISIDGGMPRHGHGLPITPKVTGALGGGRYLVEGVKFNMPGWWTIKLGINGLRGADTATFNLML